MPKTDDYTICINNPSLGGVRWTPPASVQKLLKDPKNTGILRDQLAGHIGDMISLLKMGASA